MPDATPNPIPPGTLPAGVDRASVTVLTQTLNPILMQFLARLGLVHLHLFGTPVVITSAVDSVHSPNSKHAKGDAVDLRIMDKSPRQQAIFLLLIFELSKTFPVAFFDESNLPGQPHVHVEVAG